MNDTPSEPRIGKVLRASTTGFVCGTPSQDFALPSFGAFVQTRPSDGQGVTVIGLIHAISIEDDPLVRQMVLSGTSNEALVNDQRVNRLVPVEISVLNVGYMADGAIFHTLPPRPPLSLDAVLLCDDALVRRFTERLDFLRLVLSAGDLPTEELLAAALKHAAAARPPSERGAFLIDAGRQIAALWGQDLARLQHVLRLIRAAL